MPDSAEKRKLAAQQRDQGLLSAGDPDYDKKMRDMWGGPPPKWYDAAVEAYAASHPAPGKTALVTGGGGGIGFYVVKALARLGFSVLVPARPGMERDAQEAVAAVARAVPGAKLEVPATTLDLGSFASVRAFAAAVRESLGCLDLLCLNAGRGGGQDDPREVTQDGHEAIMQVNALSHFLLAYELLPLVRASPAGRIVSQSSGARYQAKLAKVGDLDGTDAAKFSAWDQYCLSKAANALFTLKLAEHLAAAGVGNVKAIVSEPGLTATGVNIQHDLVKSVGLSGALKDTNQMHDVAGHHAADGSLPMVLACVDPAAKPGDWYTTDGAKAKGVPQAAYKQDPAKKRASQPHEDPATDPLNESSWPREARATFWEQAVKMTGATWSIPAAKM